MGRRAALIATMGIGCALIAARGLAGCGDQFVAANSTPTNEGGAVDGESSDVDGADLAIDAAGGDGASCAGVNLTGDPKNCGACGHDCLGGTCSGGKCQPSIFATTADVDVYSIVVDGDHVTWGTAQHPTSDKGAIYTCPLGGCAQGASPLAITYPGALASNGTTAYVSGLFDVTAGLYRIDDGSLTRLSSFNDEVGISALYAKPNGLYVDNFGQSDAGQPRTVRFFDGTNLTPIGPTFSGDGDGGANLNTEPIVGTKSRVFLGTIDLPLIVGCALTGCSEWSVFASDANLYVLSMTGTDDLVIWVDLTNTVRACADGPTCPAITTLLSTADLNGADAKSVVVSAGDLYVETSAGDLFACDPKACVQTKRTIVHENTLAVKSAIYGSTVFATNDAIYWAALDGPDGGTSMRIMKLAK